MIIFPVHIRTLIQIVVAIMKIQVSTGLKRVRFYNIYVTIP